MKKRKLDFTKDMPLSDRRKIQDKRCSKCKHGIMIQDGDYPIWFECESYGYYWHYIREGICNQYKKKNLKA